MWAAFDDLDVADGDAGGWGGGGRGEGNEGEEGDDGGEGEGAGGHEPEGILRAGEGVVHCGLLFGTRSLASLVRLGC